MTVTPHESAHTGRVPRLPLPGPDVCLPVRSKVAPWQGQRSSEPLRMTGQHACVQEVESAEYFPAAVWMTMIWFNPQFGSE